MAASTAVINNRNFRRHTSEHRRFHSGSLFRHGSTSTDAECPAGSLEKLRCPQSTGQSRRRARRLELIGPRATTTTPCRALRTRSNTIGSPQDRRSATISPTPVSVWGSLSWGFRAPTLNELYRQFAVGQVTTLANDQLGPERLTAGEGGVTYSATRNLTWRSSWFV